MLKKHIQPHYRCASNTFNRTSAVEAVPKLYEAILLNELKFCSPGHLRLRDADDWLRTVFFKVTQRE